MSQILYQIKVQLAGSEPPVWRRFQVLSQTPLDQLHDIIQVVMGWDNDHFYQFMINDEFYSAPEVDETDQRKEARHYQIGQLIKRGKTSFLYEYDLSDGWEHEVTVEKIRPIPELDARQLPLCLEGENATPPEECGGIFGYYELMSILKDPTHDAYDEMREQYGDIDPKAFDNAEVNQALKVLFRR